MQGAVIIFVILGNIWQGFNTQTECVGSHVSRWFSRSREARARVYARAQSLPRTKAISRTCCFQLHQVSILNGDSYGSMSNGIPCRPVVKTTPEITGPKSRSTPFRNIKTVGKNFPSLFYFSTETKTIRQRWRLRIDKSEIKLQKEIVADWRWMILFSSYNNNLPIFYVLPEDAGPRGALHGYRSARSNSVRTVIEVMYQRPCLCFCCRLDVAVARPFFFFFFFVASSAPVRRKQMIPNKFFTLRCPTKGASFQW